jgi:hypothetical protein
MGPLGTVWCAFDGILKRNYARMLFVCSSEEHHGDIWEPRGTFSALVANSIPICIGAPLLRSNTQTRPKDVPNTSQTRPKHVPNTSQTRPKHAPNTSRTRHNHFTNTTQTRHKHDPNTPQTRPEHIANMSRTRQAPAPPGVSDSPQKDPPKPSVGSGRVIPSFQHLLSGP